MALVRSKIQEEPIGDTHLAEQCRHSGEAGFSATKARVSEYVLSKLKGSSRGALVLISVY